jgi:tRNA nucleotidyltransferase (CCA-adding enzyme)
MWYKYSQEIQRLPIELPDYVNQILSDIAGLGGRALCVGGAVRDALLGIKPKDIDFEVYGLSYDQLGAVLKKYGRADLVGKAFGVIKFVGPDGGDFDFSLPRKDSKAGVGHKDFNVEVSSELSPKEAAARRDFTINAISYDPITGEIIDPYNGKEDLENKILRHTSEAFSEDPLRVLRGMNFIGRFGFDIAPETAALAKSIKDEYKYLPKERVYEEFKKLTQKGIEPGRALDYLYKTGWSENFPHIHNLQNVEQEEEYHPEIWLDEHTKQVMDQAARIAIEQNLSPEEKEILVYAALCHDFAKPATTKRIMKKGKERITSHGHEEAGGPMAKHFLEQIGVPKHIINKVVPLVENHLNHIHMKHSKKQDSFIKNLAERLHPATVEELHRLINADHTGRRTQEQIHSGQNIKSSQEAQEMANKAQENGVYQGRHPDLLQGKDLIAAGMQPGKEMGDLLKEHRKLILHHKITNRDEALNWMRNKLKTRLSFINGQDVLNNTTYRGPEIKKILDQAWTKQQNKEFNTRDEALKWLQDLQRGAGKPHPLVGGDESDTSNKKFRRDEGVSKHYTE